MVNVHLTLVNFEPADTCNEMNQLTCLYRSKFSKTAKAMPCSCSMDNVASMLIKYLASPHALLASWPCTSYFMSR